MAKNIFRGQTTVNNIYRGNTPLSKVYRGNTEIWSSGPPPFVPPVTADVISFQARDYSGTGNWIDNVGSYEATLVDSPTFVSDGDSSYWDLDGTNDGFNVDSAQLPTPLWDTQGSTGNAEGALEFVIYADDLIDQPGLWWMWSGNQNNRVNYIGNLSTTVINTAFGVAGTNQEANSFNISLGLGNWKHLVWTWNQSSNVWDIYLNGTSVGSATWNQNSTWRSVNQCIGIGYYIQDCTGNPRRYFNGRMAAVRAYSDELSSSNISSLYSFWSNYFTFA